MGTIFLIVFIDLVGFGMIIPILPLWAEAYHPTPAVLGLLMATFSLMQFIGAPILGRLSDRSGRRPILLFSLLGAASGYGLLAVARSLPILFLSRFIAGLAGGNISTAQAVITDVTTPADRAKGMGLIGAAFGLGFIFGPAVGGVLVGIHPWLPGLAAMTTSLVAFVLTWFTLPETRVKGGGADTVRRTLSVGRFRAALAHPSLGSCLLVNFLAIFAFAAFESTFAQYLNWKFILSPRQVSYVFVVAGLLSALVQGGLVGRLAKTVGDARLVVAGAVLGAIGLALVPLAASLVMLFVILTVFALGQGVGTPSLSSLTSMLVPGAEIGAVMGVFQSVSSLARIVGPFAGQLALGRIELASKSAPVVPASPPPVGHGWPYWSGAIAMGIAAIIAFRMRGGVGSGSGRVRAEAAAARSE